MIGHGDTGPVSVVIPCYNHARFLGEAIESVLVQTVAAAEILVVDDGSTDDVRAVASHYPGVRVAGQANLGLSAARNRGIHETVGAYLVFLDADDRLRPAAIEAGLVCMKAHPDAAFVFGDYVDLLRDGRRARGRRPAFGPDLYVELLRGNLIGMHATVMYRRRTFETFGGFDVELNAAEDYELLLRVARQAPVAHHGTIVAEYRRHDQSMSANFELMLRASLSVLAAQAPYTRGRRRLCNAAGHGRGFWWRLYGLPYRDSVLRRLAQDGDIRAVAAALRVLARHHPASLPSFALDTVSGAARHAVRRLRPPARDRLTRPAFGAIRFGDLRRLVPISRPGFERGQPIDRYYIEQFLGVNAGDLHGRVLEIGERGDGVRFAGDRLTHTDTLRLVTTESSDPARGPRLDRESLEPDSYDACLLVEGLDAIDDIPAAIAALHRLLKPGGVLLATFPGIGRIVDDEGKGRGQTSFTAVSARRLVEPVFAPGAVTVEVWGNVLAATAFLHGLAAHEFRREELTHFDPSYPMVITIRAVKR